jgi:hypothetical protein
VHEGGIGVAAYTLRHGSSGPAHRDSSLFAGSRVDGPAPTLNDELMIKQVPGAAGEERWVSDRGELRIRRPAPLVLLYVETGFLEADFSPLISRAMDGALKAQGKPLFFVDAEALDGYEPTIRAESSAWIKKHSSQIACQHMLVKSRLAKMGLAVVSMLLGGIIVGHEKRQTFEAALRQAILASQSPGASLSS